eukprot:CAMPEP_0172816382 /NCGR_PEP_ID=MMETSP1075-20121228/12429_1 /TAXON_ID=2916 /ORGANISM="Ceratium fusus, Strain PA161109" /LENGTH=32 /DNA_ID= /DNA_START= /DNA_END= /DNA_ORIENTATION=
MAGGETVHSSLQHGCARSNRLKKLSMADGKAV